MSVWCHTNRNSVSVLSVFLSSENLIVSIGVGSFDQRFIEIAIRHFPVFVS
jgi:hypothetical protein